MKRHLMRGLVFCALMTGLPMIPALLARNADAEESEPVDPVLVEFTYEETQPPSTEPATEECTEDPYFLVLDTAVGEVLKVPVREYVIGAVCAEMPASFEPEALKAQAVAAYTYALRQALVTRSRADGSLQGADFSNDPAKYQAFYTYEQIRIQYGTYFEQYYPKVEAAVDAVLGEALLYEEVPIIAAFHAMSGGTTESAENVWGSPISYLQPVDSSTDCDAPRYEETITLTDAEMQESFPDAEFEGERAAWFGEPVCSASGTVLELTVGGSPYTGQEIRAALGLRSANFEITCLEEGFSVTTFGYGHGVGMSQYGANGMALAGADYREILMHYYPGTKLAEYEFCRNN